MVAFAQRGRRGWADRDTWDLDSYLSEVIAGSLRHRADSAHGWPGDNLEVANVGDWQSEVRELVDIFDRFAGGRTYRARS